MEYEEILKDAIVTTLSCLVGGWAAIKFQILANKRSDRNKEIECGRLAQLAILRQYNLLLTLNKELLEKYPDTSPNGIGMIPPFITVIPSDRVDVISVSYLFDENSKGLLSEIRMAEDKFQNISNILTERNRHHTQLQIKYAESPTGKMELNKQEYFTLKSLTEALRDNTSDAISYYEDTMKKLFNELKSRFPEQLFFKFQKS